MNLEDIARKAGVSRSTVSRVINNEDYVSEKTRARVMAVIEQEGFTPNPAARALVTQRTQVIGVVIPTAFSVVFEDSLYFPTLLQGISEATHARDYATLLWLGQPSEDEELFHKRVLKNRLMDGLIIASATKTNQGSFIDHLLRMKTPFVMVERPIHRAEEVSYVTVDNVQAAQNAVSHLINQGRRRIGIITGDMDNADGLDRFQGYKNALLQAHLPFDATLVMEGHFTQRSGYLGMKALLERNVDAVFASSDLTAVGALQAIQEAGLHVPKDISLVGFDDLPHSQQTLPQLTTVRHPIQRKGAHAATVLLDLIEGVIEGPQQILLPTQLVIRESCGALIPDR